MTEVQGDVREESLWDLRALAAADLPTDERAAAVPAGPAGPSLYGVPPLAGAALRPLEVEVPFELRLVGLSLRWRMDAVFLDPDDRYDVVDWKTGQPPTVAAGQAAAVQLAAYRLAWSDLTRGTAGVGGAAFHYVRQNRTIRPAYLLDAAGLQALVEDVPAAG